MSLSPYDNRLLIDAESRQVDCTDAGLAKYEAAIEALENEVGTQGAEKWWALAQNITEATSPSDLVPLFSKADAAILYAEAIKAFIALVDTAMELGPDIDKLAEIVGYEL